MLKKLGRLLIRFGKSNTEPQASTYSFAAVLESNKFLMNLSCDLSADARFVCEKAEPIEDKLRSLLAAMRDSVAV